MTDSLEDYTRAEKFIPWNFNKLIFNARVQPLWIESTDKFWYVKIIGEKKEFILVDLLRNEIKPTLGEY